METSKSNLKRKGIFVMPDDHRKILAVARRERRPIAQQVGLLIDAAYRAAGLETTDEAEHRRTPDS